MVRNPGVVAKTTGTAHAANKLVAGPDPEIIRGEVAGLDAPAAPAPGTAPHLALNRRGVMLNLAGQPEKAVKLFQKAIALVPDYPTVHYNLGSVLVATRHFPEAIAAFRRVIELDPNYSQAYQNLGAALYATGEITEAMSFCNKAIALKHDYSKAHYLRGLILAKTGPLPDAVAAFRKAIEADPQFAEAHHYLGLGLGKSGQIPDAMSAFRKAIELGLKPDLAGDAHYVLGLMLRDAGNFPEAIAALRKALPEDGMRQNVLEELNKLVEQESGNNTSESNIKDYNHDAMDIASRKIELLADDLDLPGESRSEFRRMVLDFVANAKRTANRRAQWENRKGDDLKLTPPQFIAKHYAAEMAEGTLHRGVISREDRPLAVKLASWLRSNPMPEGIDIPTLPEWNTRQIAAGKARPAPPQRTDEGRLYQALRRRRRAGAQM